MNPRSSRAQTVFGLAVVLAVIASLGPAATAAPASAVAIVGPGGPPAIEGSLPLEAAVFLGCDKLPAGPRAVRLGLAGQGADVAVRDVLGLMTSLSCSPVQAAAGVALETKVKMASPPDLVSAREAFSIMDAALSSAGLILQAEKTGPLQFQLRVRPRAASDHD
jgi:hypothetical protein